MGFFSKIGLGIKKAAAKVGEFFARKPQAPPEPPKPAQAPQITAPPVPEYQSKEIEALRRAMDILIAAETHPDDATYTQARDAALIYINKSQALKDKGKSQSGNRKYVAERYLKNELSSQKGVETRKKRKLDVFNANFGFTLSEEQAETVGKLMESNSFKKLMETYREKYDVIIGMVGDQIENGVDPVRIEQTLDIWQRVDIEPDFTAFSSVTELSQEEFGALREDLMLYAEENVHADEYQRQEDIDAILGGYITW